MRRQDWHGDKAVSISLVQLARKPGGFASEDKHDIGRFSEWHIPKKSLRLGREEIRIAERRQRSLERIPAWPHARIDIFPIVQAGSLHLTLIERKAKGLDEMQNGAGRKARTARVSSVPMNFGMYEHDVRFGHDQITFF